MSRLLAILMAIVLAGCAGLSSQQHIETVAGKQYIYVAVKSGGSVLDHTLVMSLYGPDGSHIMSQTISNNGVLETLGGAALQTMVPAWNALQATK